MDYIDLVIGLNWPGFLSIVSTWAEKYPRVFSSILKVVVSVWIMSPRPSLMIYCIQAAEECLAGTAGTTEQSTVKWRVPFRMRKTAKHFEVRLGPPGGDKVRLRRLSDVTDVILGMCAGIQGHHREGSPIHQYVLVDKRLHPARANRLQGRDLLLQGAGGR